MTRENRIICGLDDIKAVIFECRKCQTRVSVKTDDPRVPHKCPNCGEQWRPDILETVSSPKAIAERFCKALMLCRTMQDDGGPFTILLEFEAE